MIKYIDAKHILHKNKTTDWFGANYCVNLYRGCCHGCIYCDSRSECYQDTDFDIVKPKKNAIQILELELQHKRKSGIIDTGAMSDPYNPLEKNLKLTRQFLYLAKKYEFGVSITTKGTLIERDIDILQEISLFSPVICQISITTPNDMQSSILEPYAPLSSQRFYTLSKLANANIFSGIVMMPILPFLEDTEENVLSIVKIAAEKGARFIYPYFGVTLRQNQKDYYFQKLKESFPKYNYAEQYIKNYGNQYECLSLQHSELKFLFENECNKYGILFEMDRIVSEYQKKYYKRQLSLFE